MRLLTFVNKFSDILKLLIAGFLSLLGLYFAFKGENIVDLYKELIKVDYLGILIASLLLLISCLIRAYRWKLLIDPIEKLPLKKVFSSTMIGYFGNGVLVFRLGEILKAYSVSKSTKISTSEAFGTVIIERVLDLLMVVLIFFFTIPWFPFKNESLRVGIFSFSFFTFLSLVIVFIIIRCNWLQKVESIHFFKSKIGTKILKICSDILKGIKIIKNNEKKIKIAISSTLLWLLYILITFIILACCNIELNFYNTIILFLLGSLSLGIPALPGSAGTYDAAVKYGLVVLFSIESNEALSYALISHAVSYFPLVLVGALFFVFGAVNLRDIKAEKIT